MKEGVISKIEAQKNNKDRCSIFVDGEFLIGVEAGLVYKYNLKKGREVGKELLDNLLTEEKLKEAKEAAFRLLAYRQRSKKELKDRLARKGFSTDTIREVIRILDRLGYINDRKFANSWIKDRIVKGFGPYRIRQQLREKGVKDKIIEEELAEEYDLDLEYKLASELANKKKGRYVSLPYRERRYKLKQVLKRKGFFFEVIEMVLDDVVTEEE